MYVDATDRFLFLKLESVADPEEKREVLGGEFIRMLLRKKPASWTVSTSWDKVPCIAICREWHKNSQDGEVSSQRRRDLPKRILQFELVELMAGCVQGRSTCMRCRAWIAVRDRFTRQPFPVPDWECVLGAITRDQLGGCTRVGCRICVRNSNWQAWIRRYGSISLWCPIRNLWVYATMHVRSTGPSFIRASDTVDAMTATIEPVDWPILMKNTDRILKEVKTVNSVCYNISQCDYRVGVRLTK